MNANDVEKEVVDGLKVAIDALADRVREGWEYVVDPDVVSAELINQNISGHGIKELSDFIGKILDFYASDEATPLLEQPGFIDLSSVVELAESALSIDEAEPTDEELRNIEQKAGWLYEHPSESDDLWRDKEKEDADPDFSFGFQIKTEEDELNLDNEIEASLEEEEPLPPEYFTMTRREKKKLKKLRRERQRNKKRNNNYGIDNFEITTKKNNSNFKLEEKIHYEFDTCEASYADEDIGKLVDAKFEEKTESTQKSFSKPKFSKHNNSLIGFPISPSRMQNFDNGSVRNGGNPYKRSYGWIDSMD